jgi:hypothetical protein
MAQQTAIEWLVEQLPLIQQEGLRDIFEQAKAMEKEQITQAHLLGLLSLIKMEATKQVEQYYNETYNK